MSLIKLKPINTETLEKETEVESLISRSKAIVITNQTELDAAVLLLLEVKQRYKDLESQRKSITNPMDIAKKAVMDLFRNPMSKLEELETKLKKAIMVFDEEQKRLAAEEQKKIQALIDKENEKLNKSLDKKILKAEESGNQEKVQELLLQKNSAPAVAPVITPTIEKPKSISYKITYVAEVVDVNLVPREWMIPNIQALTKIGQATKGTVSIPGVVFREQKTVASRS